jgi:competence protein ComEC
MARARQLLADALLRAAGTDVGRIRAAELAAALAVGRRDLMAAERREGWRRSGFSHALSVSGLHVSLVGGALWLAAVACRVRPRLARLAVLLALPAYAVLAGAAPPALRAALMGSAYMGARLMGRAVVPMAAVLLATSLLLIASPQLVFDVGFQLTVVITAALVRWVPLIAQWLPGRWLAGAVAVPLVAQAASAPLLAAHFRSSTPGALIANLAVAPLLAPMLLLSLAATALAPATPLLAGWCLDLLNLCERALWLCGAPGRLLEMPVSPLPMLVTARRRGRPSRRQLWRRSPAAS